LVAVVAKLTVGLSTNEGAAGAITTIVVSFENNFIILSDPLSEIVLVIWAAPANPVP
jgi:hypothetical protein